MSPALCIPDASQPLLQHSAAALSLCSFPPVAHVTTGVISKLNYFPCLQYFVTIWRKKQKQTITKTNNSKKQKQKQLVWKFQDLASPLTLAGPHTTFLPAPLSRPDMV